MPNEPESQKPSTKKPTPLWVWAGVVVWILIMLGFFGSGE
jgi:hypothetical protein